MIDEKIVAVQSEQKQDPASHTNLEHEALKHRHDLDLIGKRAEHLRTEQLKKVFARCVNSLLYLMFALIGFALVIVAWHYLTPNNWHWVEQGTLDIITTSVFSGSLFATVGLYIRDRIR